MANSFHRTPLNKGAVNLPGSTPQSVALLQELLRKDYEGHHCFTADSGLHNHLTHHLMAVHDLGAPASLLQVIYDEEVSMQRPLRVADKIEVTELNWTLRLGKPDSYADYLDFFSTQISACGITRVLQRYVFDPEANRGGAMMLVRLMSGLIHPFIQLGFGIEFGQDCMVAQGLAEAAVTAPGGIAAFEMPSALPALAECNPAKTTLLELLREVYDSPTLAPVMPYDPDALMVKRLRDWMADPTRAAEIRRIYDKWSIDLQGGDEEFDRKVEECIFQATLLVAATGKPGRAPRHDFFLMHYLTSAIFLPTVLKKLPTPTAKAQLLQSYVRVAAVILMLRGRPRIDIPLIMSCSEFPQPPEQGLNGGRADSSAFGKPDEAGGTNPWFAIVRNALHHPEPHVAKSVRALYYGAQAFGHITRGGVLGAFDASGAETHPGAGQLDGTVFLRAAGSICQALGWVTHGQPASDWDRSALGWEEAWVDGN
ncbi:hypothetical protein B0H15DRAFT_416982 [Mycena belliarum]|uniref:Uncharacterized protein n=1 Tax=Mycena belliarum TaxID=1033014 RepID=A0AAD6XS49_9AGAR|nr:hypothetical protein B0H15DRAFT_416982 [Mycena belliae]